MLNFQHCKDNAFFSFKTEIFEEIFVVIYILSYESLSLYCITKVTQIFYTYLKSLKKFH